MGVRCYPKVWEHVTECEVPNQPELLESFRIDEWFKKLGKKVKATQRA